MLLRPCFVKWVRLLPLLLLMIKHFLIILIILTIDHHFCLAVDRSLVSSISDAREALINSVLDLISTYKNISPSLATNGLVISYSTRLLALYICALLKHVSTVLKCGHQFVDIVSSKFSKFTLFIHSPLSESEYQPR